MISDLLTPQNILQKEEHEQPYIIFPQDFKSFDDLLEVRELIRDLRLVPIKSDDMQKYYHSFSKEHLLNQINFTDSNILYLKNNFPYLLPEDVSQNIIWIKEGTSDIEIFNFIEDKIENLGDVILFERSPLIKTKLVKSSFPHIKHIHLWHIIQNKVNLGNNID
jgi:hypothetical protein